MIHKLPDELKLRPQWLCSRPEALPTGKIAKKPYSPRTRQLAEVNNPACWCTFDEAVRADFPLVGYVIADTDPYTFIDLDEPVSPEQLDLHNRILAAFDTYIERSYSGKGYHIIVRGTVPKGCRLVRDNVEIYSSGRFMVCTGDIVKDRPIRDYQQVLDNMVAQLAPSRTFELADVQGAMTDAELVEMAMNATNADKFNTLCSGDMSGYPSQSEADLALMSILAFYTPDNDQVKRLFRMSALGKREKAQREDYLNYTLRRIRANEPPPVSLDQLYSAGEAVAQAAQTTQTPVETPIHTTAIPEQSTTPERPPAPPSAIEFPQNLLGAIAQYIYESAPRPVKEIALAGALTVFAGIVGRQYNISSTGLNLYTILLARTGTGKEAAASGASQLLRAVRMHVPMIDTFRGPATFASAPAIVKSLVEKPCQFVVLGEFGVWLKDLCNPHTVSGPNPMIRRALLDLYHKSGWANMLMGTEYSDNTKNVQPVVAPCLTVLGETTPETFFEGLDENMLSSGLLPRFLTIEYQGERVPLNPARGHEPSDMLVHALASVSASVLQAAHNNTNTAVAMDAAALTLSDDFEHYTTSLINQTRGTGVAEMWNRAHLKALRVAALNAVAMNPHAPVVRRQEMEWAINMVQQDAQLIVSRFASGNVGVGDAKLIAELRNVIHDYLTTQPKAGYKVDPAIHAAKLIPYSYLQRRCGNRAAFMNHKLGSTQALSTGLKALIDGAELVEVPKQTMHSKFRTAGRTFGIGDSWKGA